MVAAGYCIYHGPANSVLPYFSSIGYTCEEHDNPADFLLDVTQDSRAMENDEELDPDEKREQTALYLKDLYIKSPIYASMKQEITNSNNQKLSRTINEQPINSKSRLTEILYVCQRTLRNVYRNPALVLMQTVVTIIFAVLVGLIYLQIDDTQETGVKNRLGAIFFITINQVMSNLSSIELFIKERVFFIHENASGYYHVSTYFIAKLLCDLIPLRIIPSILFSSIVYFMIGFQPTVEKFFIFYLAVFITVLCAVALCFFISASVQVFGIASLLSVMSFVLMMIFGGFLVELSSIVSFLSWIKWISIFRYTMNIITINEFSGLELCLKNNSTICTNGTDIIHNVAHIEYETQWDLWKNFVALGSMMMIFFILAYIQLLRMKKTK